MPIPEIIDEIDAYLSRLRQARELLLDISTKALQQRAPRITKTANSGQGDPASSNKRQAAKNKSRSNHAVAHLKRGSESVDFRTQVTNSVPPDGADSGLPAVAQPERIVPQAVVMPPSVVIKRLPSKGPRASLRSMRLRTPKPTVPTPDPAKAAIALAGPVKARIVVVPAEQVRKEREQASQPEVRKPRVPASGLTGRLAFEALFK